MLNDKVCVLMSTYNGERYLQEQINSILKQSVPVELYIRDDGSNDQTVNIIEDYIIHYPNVHFIEDNRNLGPAVSFMTMLYQINGYSYYAFADQDDIWKVDKLKVGIERCKNTKASLYCSNQIIYKDKKECGMRFLEEPPHNPISIIFNNYISGCTMIMNSQLRDLLIKNQPTNEILKLRMHDTWVILVASLQGLVFYDNNSYIDYRIHTNNTVGIKGNTLSTKIKQFKKNYKNMKSLRARSKLATLAIDIIDNNSIWSNDLYLIAHYNDSLKAKFKLLHNKNIKQNMFSNKIIFVINVVMGWL